jgi:hypothetical protein
MRLLAALVLAAGAAHAQEDRHRHDREEAFRMVDAYVVSHLQESLGLSDEQFAKAVPLVTRLQRERREYLMGRVRLMREMRRLLREGGSVEAKVLEKLEEYKKLEAEAPDRIQRSLEALDAMLTPLQQSKYRVLEADVEQRMRALAARAREASRPRREQQRP